jgi:N-acetylglucosamine-6-phosphate deacetylase
MFVLAGADIVLPDRILTRASLLVDDDRILAIDPRERVEPGRATIIDAPDHYVVPGFVDVHVHGVLGHDTLDGGNAIDAIAAALPRFGVTAFCPTTVACSPADLSTMLQAVRLARVSPVAGRARVLPAHLESNFINPEYRGAQPFECIRTAAPAPSDRDFSGNHILDVISTYRADVGIVTMAPEMPGGLELVSQLVAAGHVVSIGHTGATYEEAEAAIDAGARHATHLFNRMSPLGHRAPGVTGAVLSRDEVCAELICDGYHVHPAVSRVAIATKGTSGIMAITDATGCAGLEVGSTARLGGRSITVGERAALLPDGTLAGSTLTMDRAFRNIVEQFGGSIVDAALLCSTSPARQLRLTGFGVLASGAVADFVVLDRAFRVVRTFIAGLEVYSSEHQRPETV